MNTCWKNTVQKYKHQMVYIIYQTYTIQHEKPFRIVWKLLKTEISVTLNIETNKYWNNFIFSK